MFSYKYPRPSVTVDALVYTREGNSVFILLIQRGNEPFRGKWALPGGFMDNDELLEDACKRELFEETGVEIEKMIQFKTYDAIGRDPRGRNISVVYYTEVEKKIKVNGGDDASQAEWFPVEDLPPLAFDHKEIISQFFADSI
jgi:8-oxo-dGTP diphosphatase